MTDVTSDDRRDVVERKERPIPMAQILSGGAPVMSRPFRIYLAAIGVKVARDQVEQSGFAGTVGPNGCGDGVLLHPEGATVGEALAEVNCQRGVV